MPMKLRAATVCLGLLLAGSGCAHLNNPWEDSSVYINDEMKTTSSEEYVHGQPEFPRDFRRVGPESEVRYENGSVTHWPLWFEDPFEDKGNRYVSSPGRDRNEADNQFAVNWVDYMHLAYGPSRLLLNIAGWPVSAVVTPPGTLMESDGRLSRSIVGRYDHDAKRSDSVNREPPHFNIISKNTAAADGPPADESVYIEPPPPEPSR